MPQEDRNVQLDRNGGNPQVEILIGQAQFGAYAIYLWDANGQNEEQIGSGVNDDEIADEFTIGGDVVDLHQRYVTWQADLVPLGGGQQNYAVFVLFKQDGEIVRQFSQIDSFTASHQRVFGQALLDVN